MNTSRNTQLSEPVAQAPTDQAVQGSQFAVLAIILVSYLMIVLDISIVITGLPKIHENLGFSVTGLSWVQNAYTLCFGGFLLLGARAGDLLGRRRIFIIGLAVFTAASLVIGLAPTPAWLIGARAVQGLSAAILAPAVLALLSTNFPAGPERTRALAYYSMVAGVGSSLGLVLGGIFADWISWRVGFVVNVPIGIVLMIAAGRILTNTEWNTVAFDLVGAITSTIGMTALVYGIVRSADARWNDPATLSVIAVGLFFLTLFFFNEARVRQPLLPLWLFASRERSGAYASGLVNVAHQLGGSLGLGILVVVFAAAGTGTLEHRQLLAHQIAAAITGGGVMLMLALVIVVALIIRPWTAMRVDPHVCECLA